MKQIKTSTALIIVLAVAVLIGGGALTWAYAIGMPDTDVSIQSPIKITNATKNWKTYTNTKYGYSIKYPSNTTPSEKNGVNDPQSSWSDQTSYLLQSVDFVGGSESVIKVEVTAKTDQETILAELKLNGYVVSDIGTNRINGHDFNFFAGSNIRMAYTVENSRAYIIQNFYVDDYGLNNILDTFKFTK